MAALTLTVLLVLRITLAREPFAGWSLALGLASGALACLAVWILVSAAWSHAPARAIVEFDRVLLYGLVLTLTGSLANRVGDIAVLLRWAGGAFAAIALAGLVTRLFPSTFPITAGVLPERVGFPLTYWNAMGIACAHGLPARPAPHGERARAAGGARAGGGTAGADRRHAVLHVLPRSDLGRSRWAWSSTSGWPARAECSPRCRPRRCRRRWRSSSPTTRTSWPRWATPPPRPLRRRTASRSPWRPVRSSRRCCALAALPLDARLAAVRLPEARERALRRGLAAAALVVVVVGGLAAHVPQRIADAKATFERGQYLPYNADLRTRLTSAVDNGRIDDWRVDLDGFRTSPLHGTGAGTFALTWERDRPAPPVHIVDGHSLYLETLSEMGVPGLVFVVVTLATLLGAGLRRLRGPERHAYAAFVAAGTMLAVHAGIDWDWEMPALFAWLFGAGGVALAAREGERPAWELARIPRVAAGLAVLVLAITPWLILRSQAPLLAAQRDFAAGDCPAAVDAALTASERFGVRPEPWEVLGYCDARAGQYALATQAMNAAHDRDPGNWEYVYGQAIMAGVAGRDPRPDAVRALRLNPLEPLARTLVRDLARARTAARRRAVTRRAGIPFQ